MPFQAAMRTTAALVAQIETAGALAAWLGSANRPLAPGIAEAVASVVAEVGAADFADLTPAEKQMMHGFLRSFLRQASDLVEHPDRPAGWSFDDPVILQNIGQVSRSIVMGLAALAEADPWLADRLARPARFLDAGTGVGWIAIDAARRWPLLQVTGIDIFDPALALGAGNVAASGVADRVTLRHQDLTTLTDDSLYAMAFLAAPFMPEPVILDGLDRLRTALEPGGRIAFGIFEAPPEPLAKSLLSLRITRFGGRIWTVDEAKSALSAAGFQVQDQTISMMPARLIIGQRPL